MLLFLAILLVAALAFNVANLDTGGEAIPAVQRPSPLPESPESLASFEFVLRALFAGIAAAAIVLTVYGLLRPRERVQRVLRPTSWWDVMYTLVSAGFFLALVLAIRRASQDSGAGAAPAETSDASGAPALWPRVQGLSPELFLIGGLFAGLVVVTLLLRRTQFFPRFRGEEAATVDRAIAARTVRETIEHLELGADVRSAILLCYRRFCVLLGEHGLGDQDAMTAREIEVAAVDRLRVSKGEASQLTSLFEEARYSAHPLGEPHRDRAVRSLDAIRATLEA